MAVDLSSYLTVAQRVAEFRAKHPGGSLQPAEIGIPFKVIQVGDRTFITYTALAFRTPDDPRPGVGVAWEPWPGKTPYTRDSELQNAETSAWGRAIVAALAADTTVGIATQDEIRNRQAERDTAQERHPANVRKLPDRRPAENSQIDQLANLQILVKNAKEAKTLDSLRTVWTEVGDKGFLNEKLAQVGHFPRYDFHGVSLRAVK